MTNSNHAQTDTPGPINLSLLRSMANKLFAKSVDCDMRGSPITDCDVLLHGAHGPAVMRLMNLVAQEPKAIDAKRLADLAPVAFDQAQDIDFGGNVMHDHRIVLLRPHGFGDVTLKLANLVIEHKAVLRVVASPQ